MKTTEIFISRVRSYIRSHFLPLLIDDERKRVADLVFVIAVGMVGGIAALLGVRAAFLQFRLLFPLTLSLVSIGISLMFLRKGFVEIAANFLLYTLLALIIHLVSISDGFRDTAMLGVPGILVAAGLILPRWQFVLFTSAALCAVGLVGIAESYGFLRISVISAIGPFDVIDVLTMLGITAMTIRLLSDTMLANMRRSKKREEELRIQSVRLKESEEKFHALFDAANDAIYLLQHNVLAGCNRSAVDMLGCKSADEIIGHMITDFSPPVQADGVASIEKAAALIRRAMSGMPVHFLWQLQKKDGAGLDVDVGLSVFESNRQKFLLAICRDVTEHRKAEAALQASEELYRKLVASIPDAIIRTDLDGQIVFINEMQKEPWQDVPTAALIGHNLMEYVHPDDAARAAANLAAMSAGSLGPGEYKMVLPGQREFECEVNGDVLRDTAGNPSGLVLVIRDISGRKRIQHSLKESLDEKVVLLKEIHHRVKNNLQIISSLLNIQAGEISDPAMKDLFMQSQNRVRSMALVHEKLYQSRSLSKIDLGEYVDAVSASLFHSYSRPEIRCNVDVDECDFDIDAAIPCGLIINELVSNALKHAFADGQPGTIAVRMRSIEENRIRLIVEDDGVGFPAGLDFRTIQSMGMQLVTTLAQQLNADIEMHGPPGTQFVLTFRIP